MNLAMRMNPLYAFQLEHADDDTIEWWARVNYASEDAAVRFVLRLDLSDRTYTLLVEQEDGGYGEFEPVLDEHDIAPERAQALLSILADHRS